ncbi:hypothetical protein ACLOJK_005574, partial [Asimina triloba]
MEGLRELTNGRVRSFAGSTSKLLALHILHVKHVHVFMSRALAKHPTCVVWRMRNTSEKFSTV